MGRIMIKDLPEDMEVSKHEMRKIYAGSIYIGSGPSTIGSIIKDYSSAQYLYFSLRADVPFMPDDPPANP